MKKATVIILTKDQEDEIGKCIESCIDQDYPKRDYEILVINDGSGDDTSKVAKSYSRKFRNLRVIDLEWGGRVKAENIGIRNSKNPFVVLLNADCYPRKNWLRDLMKEFRSERIVCVSSWSMTGGTSTAYRKEIFERIGYFNEEFGELGTGFRDDTDMSFRILDAGYEIAYSHTAKFTHFHESPKSLNKKIRYAKSRIIIHKFDPLLFREHPERGKEFFGVKLGFIRNPASDFRSATGLWARQRMSLSSPQGVTLLKNKSIAHEILIITLGLSYVFLVKTARMYGSLKFGKFLI